MVKKKTTYLLLLTLLVPLIFGIGMSARISFLITDGDSSIDVISDAGMGAWEFVANMLSQSTYIVYLIIIIIGSMACAYEFELGQIRQFAIRICNRRKMVWSKLFALFFLIAVYMAIYCLSTVGIYYLLVAKTKYGNGKFFSGGLRPVLYIVVTMIGMMVVIAITLLLGICFRTFHCFAISYLLWFVSQYFSFFEEIKLFAPDQCANLILEKGMDGKKLLMWLGLYMVYIMITVCVTCLTLERKDMK